MGRIARIVIPGTPHHITQRGNRNCDVFVKDSDRDVYLSMLGGAARRYDVAIWSYCLMTNHIHLVAVPKTRTGLGQMIRDAHTAYSNWFNKREGIAGHLWHARYYSAVMGESHLWAAVRYVERNPVRAGIIESAEEYPWSSAAAHCGIRDDVLVSREFPIRQAVADWRAWLSDEDLAASQTIRKHTRLGHPCTDGPAAALTKQTTKPHTPKSRGRKPKHRRARTR